MKVRVHVDGLIFGQHLIHRHTVFVDIPDKDFYVGLHRVVDLLRLNWPVSSLDISSLTAEQADLVSWQAHYDADRQTKRPLPSKPPPREPGTFWRYGPGRPHLVRRRVRRDENPES